MFGLFNLCLNAMKKRIVFLLCIATLVVACDQNKTPKIDTGAAPASRLNPIDSINAIIKEQPNNPDLYFERAKFHYGNKDVPSSLSDVGRALSLDSSKADYYLLLADLKLISKQSRESKDALLKANKLDPNNIDVLLKLGELYMVVQDADASFIYLNQALKLDVHNARAYQLKGFNYKFLRDTLNALSSFQTAIEQDPNDYDSYLQIGLFYANINNPLAEDYFNNAIKVKPQSLEARYAKGLHYQEMDETRKALDTYNEIIDLNPNYFNAYYNRGFVYLTQLEKFDSAAYEFQRAIDFGPQDYFEAHYNKGIALEMNKEFAKATEAFSASLKINPQYDLAAKGLERLLDKK
jgi:tetratricopeptide (TPR) repeat protein